MGEDAEHKAWLAAVANGDRAALGALYRALEPSVFRFLHARLNDSFEAADLLHDVFMEVWRGAGRFEGRSKVRTWVFGIAYRKLVDAGRKRARLTPMADVPEPDETAPDGAAALARAEEAAHVRTCLGTLSDDHRTAIDLAFYEDMTYREIAAVLGVAEGTVKTRIFHAKRLLLRCLQRVLPTKGPA
ncbi:MAG: RNA polymerase sigma factor [Pseudomonadota bacterium]